MREKRGDVTKEFLNGSIEDRVPIDIGFVGIQIMPHTHAHTHTHTHTQNNQKIDRNFS